MEIGVGISPNEYAFMTIFVEPKLFVKTSVTKFLWGYVDPITDACNAFDSSKCPSHKVGVMFGVSPICCILFGWLVERTSDGS